MLDDGYMIFKDVKLPLRNFVIAFEAKTNMEDCGLFSVGTNGHDRHMCL